MAKLVNKISYKKGLVIVKIFVPNSELDIDLESVIPFKFFDQFYLCYRDFKGDDDVPGCVYEYYLLDTTSKGNAADFWREGEHLRDIMEFLSL